MKKLTIFEMGKISKKALALVVAGTFVFSTTTAFATDGTEENQEDLGLEIVTETTDPSTSNEGNEVVVDEAEQQLDSSETESPSLVPGNLFYFAKIALEKIKLALTFDDAKEAELIAKYAGERLAEAEVLFANGDEDKALETIEAALSYLEDADQAIDENQSEGNNAESSEEATDGSAQTDEGTDAVAGDEPSEQTDELTNDESAADESTDENPYKDAEKLVSQNIIALTAAMEKVKNPVAKAALKKNIEKSYAKLARKIEKHEEKDASDQDAVPSSEEENTNLEENTNAETDSTTVNDGTNTENVTTPATEEKTIKEPLPAASTSKAQTKAVQKQVQKEEKKAAKAEAKQTKQQVKENKQKAKDNSKNEKANHKSGKN
jgi:hypothetical protein